MNSYTKDIKTVIFWNYRSPTITLQYYIYARLRTRRWWQSKHRDCIKHTWYCTDMRGCFLRRRRNRVWRKQECWIGMVWRCRLYYGFRISRGQLCVLVMQWCAIVRQVFLRNISWGTWPAFRSDKLQGPSIYRRAHPSHKHMPHMHELWSRILRASYTRGVCCGRRDGECSSVMGVYLVNRLGYNEYLQPYSPIRDSVKDKENYEWLVNRFRQYNGSYW